MVCMVEVCPYTQEMYTMICGKIYLENTLGGNWQNMNELAFVIL